MGGTRVERGINPRTRSFSQLDGWDDLGRGDFPHLSVLASRGGLMSGPMYRQIAEDLREQIESGRLEPGQQLLTELELR